MILCNMNLCNMSLCNKSFCNMSEPALQQTSFVLQFKNQVNAAAAVALGLPQHVPGMAINGDALRDFSSTPFLCGPLVCQLCEAEFLYDDDFASHQDTEHAGESEYRKRVLYLLQQRGCQPITAQEKRLMVQNFTAFQQFSRIGSGGNTFSSRPEVPRSEHELL